MRHLAAYILLVVGGNESPSAEDVTTLLGTAGIEVDESRLTSLLADLEGKSLDELIKLGREQLCSMGGGGGAAPAAAAPAAGGSADAAEKKPEKPKEEEVDALDGGMDMFGGGGGGGDY